MNLDDKLKLAHEYAMQAIDTGYVCETDTLVTEAWQYADAMEKQYNQRKRIEGEKSNKEVLKIINNHQNAYMNCEIQVTDENGDCRITTRQKEQERKEWQPDWSQAPDWANWWYMTADNKFKWCSEKPYQDGCSWFVDCGHIFILNTAPSFNYQGDWKGSLRERP